MIVEIVFNDFFEFNHDGDDFVLRNCILKLPQLLQTLREGRAKRIGGSISMKHIPLAIVKRIFVNINFN